MGITAEEAETESAEKETLAVSNVILQGKTWICNIREEFSDSVEFE